MIFKVIWSALMLAIGGLALGAPVSADPASTPDGRLAALTGVDQTAAKSGKGSSLQLAQAKKKYNRPPYVKMILEKRAREDKKFVLELSQFIKEFDGDKFTIKVKEDSWLDYSQTEDKLSGTPKAEHYTAVVEVSATDSYGAESNKRIFWVTIKLSEPQGNNPIRISANIPRNEGQNIIVAISDTGRFVTQVFQNSDSEGIGVRDVNVENGSLSPLFEKQGEEIVSNPSISANGKIVAFAETVGDEKVQVLWITYTDPPTVEPLQDPPFPAELGSAREAVVSLAGNGRFVAFEDDTKDDTKIVVAEVDTDRKAPRIPNAHGPSLSFDGSRIAYEEVSAANRRVLVATLNFDEEEIKISETIPIRVGSDPVVSSDGRLVAFETAEPLDDRDTNGTRDIYVYACPNDDTCQGGTLARASVDAEGHQGYQNFFNPSLSADGSLIAFDSPDGTEPGEPGQIFARRLKEGAPEGELRIVSVDKLGTPGTQASTQPALSANGHFVAFTSEATNLTMDVNPGFAVFWLPAFPPHAPVVDFPRSPPEPAAGPQR